MYTGDTPACTCNYVIMFCYFFFVEKFGAKPGYFFTLLNRCTQILKDLAGWWRSSNNMSGRLFQTREAVWMKLISSWWVFPETTWSRVDVQVLLLWCPSSWTGSYVWPGSWTVKRLLISSRHIFQAAIIFKKWASQYVLHCLLWGPACTGYICCISRALFTCIHVGFAVAHTHAESVEGLAKLPLRFMARYYVG